MSDAWLTFREAGWVAWPITLFGLIGGLTAMTAITLVALRSRAAVWIGVLAVALSAIVTLLGGFGVLRGRSVVDGVLASEAVRPIMKERIQREGYREAQSAARVGLFFGAFPLLIGSVALLASLRKKPEDPPGPSPALPVGVVALGVLSAGFAFAEMRAPLPGRPLPVDDPLWQLLEAADEVRSTSGAEMQRACDEMERKMEQKQIPAQSPEVPDLPQLKLRCVSDRIAAAKAKGPREAALTLHQMTRGWFAQSDPDLLRRIQEEEGAVAASAPVVDDAPKPGLRLMTPTVSGRLPPEVIVRIVRHNAARLRLCYEGNAAKKGLGGDVKVRFVIGADGAVTTVNDGGSTLDDPATIKCVLGAFHAISFPQPESGVVTVTYPVRFIADLTR